MSKGKLVAGIAAGLFVTYVAAAPYLTVYQMKSAADNRDGEALSEHIEFPSVRQSLKDQMNAAFARQMSKDEAVKDSPLVAFGAAFAGMIVERTVDALVTPAGITQLMAGEKPDPGATEKTSRARDRGPFEDASMSYEGFNKFVVTVAGDDGKKGRFILRRRGLGWKLTEVAVPLE